MADKIFLCDMVKAEQYIFSVDTVLRINSWGEGISKLTGTTLSDALGKKYYDIFPRIFSSDRDSVSIVLEKKKRLFLKEYRFPCPVNHFQADIRIDPVKVSNRVTGAKISLSKLSSCSVAKNLQTSQTLIDIGKTASSLAHGVRNPLNAIKGAVVYLSEKYANEPALIEFSKIIKEEINRLDNFISRFLSTSISDAGFTLTDVNALVKKIEMVTSMQAHSHNVKTVYEYGNVPQVVINSFQVEQAILNVINNALEAMQKGGYLTVRTQTERVSDIDFIVFEVSDTGPGLLDSSIGSLPSPAKDKGRGFGLFITREILQYYGGRLEIKSNKTKGTMVRLYLPVRVMEKSIENQG